MVRRREDRERGEVSTDWRQVTASTQRLDECGAASHEGVKKHAAREEGEHVLRREWLHACGVLQEAVRELQAVLPRHNREAVGPLSPQRGAKWLGQRRAALER